MTDEQPETPRDVRGGTLTDVARAVDGLVVLTRAGLRRSIIILVVCGVLIAVSTVFSAVLYFRARAQSERLVALAARLETLAEELTKTRTAAEKTQEKVEEKQAADDAKPTIEIKPTPPKPGKPAGAVVVIKPPKAKEPAVGTAAVEIPIKLPEGLTTGVPGVDGGPEKK